MRRRSPITLVCAAWLALVGLPFVSAVCQACMTESCTMGSLMSEHTPHAAAPSATVAGDQQARAEMPPCHAALERHAAPEPQDAPTVPQGAMHGGESMPQPAGDTLMACCFDDPGVVEGLSQTAPGPSVDAPLTLQALQPSTTTADRTATVARWARPPGAASPLFTLHASLLI